ncbi:hypothetical protein PV326_000878, partial [Microctonus aethiopoides]
MSVANSSVSTSPRSKESNSKGQEIVEKNIKIELTVLDSSKNNISENKKMTLLDSNNLYQQNDSNEFFVVHTPESVQSIGSTSSQHGSINNHNYDSAFCNKQSPPEYRNQNSDENVSNIVFNSTLLNQQQQKHLAELNHQHVRSTTVQHHHQYQEQYQHYQQQQQQQQQQQKEDEKSTVHQREENFHQQIIQADNQFIQHSTQQQRSTAFHVE